MIEIILGIVVAIIIVVVAFVAFSYGMKCGMEVQRIPALMEPDSNAKEENVVGNPFD